MTRIDFHTNIGDRIAYACRLARKARTADCRIVLLARERNELALLDTALWTFSALDFLPHATIGDTLAPQAPIILTDNDADETPHHEVLINLSTRVPAHFARFERMFEIVSADDADKNDGRERYRFYQQRGYPLTHFVAERT